MVQLQLLVLLFLSTPSARRATFARMCNVMAKDISIHALREESDVISTSSTLQAVQFLSTPSARRATEDVSDAIIIADISIHALREESDSVYVNGKLTMI